MSWKINFDGSSFEFDDFTIEELGAVEKIADITWSQIHPWRSILAAKAFLTVALMRQGLSDAEISERLQKLTLGEIKDAFEFVMDPIPSEEPEAESEGEVSADPLPSSTPRSSPGARKGGTGRQPKRGRAA